jgi:hypothetical protein
MPTIPTVDESFAMLQRAGWGLGDVCLLTAPAAVWLVDGTNGENRLVTIGRTQAEAWHRASARALGRVGAR